MNFRRKPLLATVFLGASLALAGCDDEVREVRVEVPVEAANVSPVASADTVVVTASSAQNLLDLLVNDSDADGDNLLITAVTAPANGNATIVAGTRIDYVPRPGYSGTDSFSYTTADGRGGSATATVTVSVNPVAAAFTMQLLHMADFEAAGPAIEDAPNLSAVLRALQDSMPDASLTLSSGDNYIPSPFFSASSDPLLASLVGSTCGAPGSCDGRGDIRILNALGIQASAFGNHDFDVGTARVADLVTVDAGWEGAQFPYLSANLDFAGDANLSPTVVADGAPAAPNSIARSVTLEVDGETIGVVGATTPTLATISSPGAGVLISPAGFAPTPTAADILALAAVIQESVDALRLAGVDKIVLLAHMQVLDIERQLAPVLSGVDIIVGGGSDTILADGNDRLRAGDTAAGTYPEVYTSAEGEPVLLVNTDGQYRYVGRLMVGFDEDGVVIPQTLNPDINGAYATDPAGVAALGNPAPIAEVAAIADAVGDVLVAREGNLFGATSVFLEGRAPGSANFGVRGEETNLGNLSADANLFVAQAVDPAVSISLKNGGGIRAAIGEVQQPPGSTNPNEVILLPPQAIPAAGKQTGDVSQFDIQTALSFNNGLAIVELTAAELRALVEHGVANQPSRQGRFPQIGGFSFSYDPTRAAGDRVRSLRIDDANGAAAGTVADVVVQNGAIVGDASRTFRMVTLGFLQRGGDGYPFPAVQAGRCVYLIAETGQNPLCTTATGLATYGVTFALPGSEQHAFAAYLQQRFPRTAPFTAAETPIALDARIQTIGRRTDTVIPAP